MLFAALGATIVGFVLLIVALVTANLWLAIACVVVSVIGVGLLLADVLTYRRADRDKSVAARFGDDDGTDEPAAWSPGDEDEAPAKAGNRAKGRFGKPAAAAAVASGAATTEDSSDESKDDGDDEAGGHGAVDTPPAAGLLGDHSDSEITQFVPRITDADADAAREAGTVGHEEFGHHDQPADPTPATGQLPLGGLTAQQWSHESAADTDDDSTRGLFAPGRYDPDMTDQIPQIEIERAWGAEWEPPEEPGKK